MATASWQPASSDAVQPFMAQQMPLKHPEESVAFARAREHFKALQDQRAKSAEAIRETNAWRSLVEAIKEKTRWPAVSNFNIHRIYEPRDVIIAAERAAVNYEERGTLMHNPFRAFARAVRDNHTFMEMFLEFIPNGDYSSILCGALTLLMTSAAQVAKARLNIIECLASLTGRFQDGEDWLKLYNNEADFQRLWDAAENLYIAILQAAQNMICWLDQSSWQHFKGTLKYGGAYSDAVKANTKDLIAASAADFEAVVGYCLHIRVAMTYDTVVQTDLKVDELLSRQEVSELSRQEDARWQELRDGRIMGGQKELEGSLKRLMQDMQKMTEAQAAHFASIHAAMEANIADLRAQVKGLEKVVEDQKPARFVLKSQEMLDVLAVPSKSSSADLEQARILGSTLASGSARRTASLLGDPVFREWLTGPQSDVLLLNGMDTRSHGLASAVTDGVVRVNDALVSQQVAISLTFLCTQHMNAGDAQFGPSGLLRSICAQLLRSAPIELELTLDNRRLIDDTAQNNVLALTSLFSMLLAELSKRIGRMIVTLMIDDISMMEDDPITAGPFLEVVRQLVGICVQVKSVGNPLILKMLFASRTVSSKVDVVFRQDEILTLQSYSHAGLKETMMPGEVVG